MGKAIQSMAEQSPGNGVTGSMDKGSGTDKLRSEDIPRGSGGTNDGTRGGAVDSSAYRPSKTGS